MKQGMDFGAWAAEVERRSADKRDYRVPTEQLRMVPQPPAADEEPKPTEDNVVLETSSVGTFSINPTAHQQIGARAGIPKKYYDKMLAACPHLLADNVNHWHRNEPAVRMLRTIDGRARALLSDRYRRLDNLDLLECIARAMGDRKDFAVASCNVDDDSFFLKVVSPKVTGEVAEGDVVRGGWMARNSEVGSSSLKITPFIERLICTNGMVMAEFGKGKRQIHAGGSGLHLSEGAHLLLDDEAQKAKDRALWEEVRSVIQALSSGEGFDAILEYMRAADARPVTGSPTAVIEELANAVGLRELEQERALEHFLTEGRMTQWGVANAVTALASDVESYDRATELETMGSQVLALPQTVWQRIAAAVPPDAL